MAYLNVTTSVHFHVNVDGQKLNVDKHTQNLIESIPEKDDSAKDTLND